MLCDMTNVYITSRPAIWNRFQYATRLSVPARPRPLQQSMISNCSASGKLMATQASFLALRSILSITYSGSLSQCLDYGSIRPYRLEALDDDCFLSSNESRSSTGSYVVTTIDCRYKAFHRPLEVSSAIADSVLSRRSVFLFCFFAATGNRFASPHVTQLTTLTSAHGFFPPLLLFSTVVAHVFPSWRRVWQFLHIECFTSVLRRICDFIATLRRSFAKVRARISIGFVVDLRAIEELLFCEAGLF